MLGLLNIVFKKCHALELLPCFLLQQQWEATNEVEISLCRIFSSLTTSYHPLKVTILSSFVTSHP
jgi:hypothetical protein